MANGLIETIGEQYTYVSVQDLFEQGERSDSNCDIFELFFCSQLATLNTLVSWCYALQGLQFDRYTVVL